MINRRKFLKSLIAISGIITIPFIPIPTATKPAMSKWGGKDCDPIGDIRAAFKAMGKIGPGPDWIAMGPCTARAYEIAIKKAIK